MPIDRNQNIGLDVGEYLTTKWGFEHVESYGLGGTFRHMVDDQHAVTAEVRPWADRPPGGGTSADLLFGVARRDINELKIELIISDGELWGASVREGLPFFGRPYPVWSSGVDRDEMRAFCDVWVERLIGEAPSLPWLVSYMELEPAPRESRSAEENDKALARQRQYIRIPRMLNRMLDGGWGDADDALFLEPWRREIAALDPGHRGHITLSKRVAAVETWVREHPDGIERELTEPRAYTPPSKPLAAHMAGQGGKPATPAETQRARVAIPATKLQAARVSRLVAMMRRGPNPSLEASTNELEQFYGPTGLAPTDAIGQADLLMAMREFVSRERVGLWLDAAEGSLAEAAIGDVIAMTVGVPDTAFGNADSHYAHFILDEDEEVEAILDEFAEWLEYDHEYRRVEALQHGSVEQVDRELRHLQLVDVKTGGDYYLAVLQPARDVAEFIELLAQAGISATCL